MRALACVLFAAPLLAAPAASGNGINPPRPAELALVETACFQDPDVEPPPLFRSTLVGGRAPDVLEFRGRSREEEAPLALVKAIVFDSRAVQADGYAKAKVVLRNRLQAVDGSVKVRHGARDIVVAGFDADGRRVEVPLVSCVQLRFTVPRSADSERPPAKKH